MMKRTGSLLLVILLLLSLCPTGAVYAGEELTEGVYTYTVTDDKATITRVENTIKGHVTVPATLGGYPVTAIGSSAFACCRSLNAVSIPAGVTRIHRSAFSDCSSLSTVTLSEGLLSIDAEAFDGCTALKAIAIPNSVVSIGSGAFDRTPLFHDESLRADGVLYLNGHLVHANDTVEGRCVILQGTKSISERAFEGCEKLTELVVPEGIIHIPERAFSECSLLERVSLPQSLETIGYGAFKLCKNLTSIAIPPRVTTISQEAFADCHSLREITWSEGVVTIESAAFADCRALTEAVLPQGVTTIAMRAFDGCTSLTTVTLPQSVTSVGEYSFRSCTALTTVTLSRDLKKIKSGAFYNCRNLTDVYYSGSESDYKALLLLDSQYFVSATWHFGICEEGHVFSKTCSTKCALCVGWRVSATPHTYATPCAAGCLVCGEVRRIEHAYTNACDTVCNLCGEERPTEHQYVNDCDAVCDVCEAERAIAHRYTAVCDTVCNTCGAVREAVPHRYTDACSPCTVCGVYPYALLDFGSGTAEMVSIGHVMGSTSLLLTPTRIPNTEQYGLALAEHASGITFSLQDFGITGADVANGAVLAVEVTYYLPASRPSDTRLVFSTDGATPHALYANYRNVCYDAVCTNQKLPLTRDAVATAVFTLGEAVTYHAPTGLDGRPAAPTEIPSLPMAQALVSGDRVTMCVWHTGNADEAMYIKSLRIYDAREHTHTYTDSCDVVCNHCGDERVPPHDFAYFCDADCNLCGFVREAAHDTDAFGNCGFCEENQYYTYKITDGAVTITGVDNTLSGAITLPPTLDGCPVTAVGEDAFAYCTGLTRVTVGASVTAIGAYAFSGCTQLREVTLPPALTQLGEGAFRGCTALTSITLPADVTAIEAYTFALCASLKAITIGGDVTAVGNGAFYGCAALADVWYGGMTSDRAAIAVAENNAPLTTAAWHYGHVLRGDVDQNGKVDSTDARLTLQYAVGKISTIDTIAADVNGSGQADSTDARLILQYAVGKIPAFSAE